MITITYADKFGRVILGSYVPADALRFLSNLTYAPRWIVVRAHGITLIA
jgi:hypothetical protein